MIVAAILVPDVWLENADKLRPSALADRFEHPALCCIAQLIVFLRIQKQGLAIGTVSATISSGHSLFAVAFTLRKTSGLWLLFYTLPGRR